MTAPVDILLVDDEPRNLDALEAILSQPDYRLLRALDADTALRFLLDHDVAAIVLDVQMPSVNGFELAKIIKTTKRFRETPIVFLTALLLEDRDVVAGYGAGAVDYLTKPFNPQILQQKIAVFAELFRKTRALAALNATLEERVRERTVELQKSEAALRAASEQKDEFLAILAHELRNPLAPLRMGVDLLLGQPQERALVDRTLGVMDRQLRHMVRLIDDLLDISRLSRGLLELKTEPCDLRALFESTAETFRPMLATRNQVLELALTRDLTVMADPTRIAQVLGNLLSNAMKFTPAGGQIRIELVREGSHAVARVIDSGIGIPAGQEDRIFEMFARVVRPGRSPQPGLGIGLALGRRLATLHGGTLDGQSKGEGHGSTFTLILPLAQGGQVPSLDASSAAEARGPGKAREILVVEDNEDVASILVELLEEHGHSVSAVQTGADGVRRAQELQPEIILCDLGLPDMDGFEVCRQIRAMALDRQPVMVALTGWGRESDREGTKAAGFDYHLVKPIGSAELEGILESARRP
jgi:signal transduction histidine kinase